MTKENLGNELKGATINLLEIARDCSWNPISDHCFYILTEIQDSDPGNFWETKKLRKQKNKKKKAKSLNQTIPELQDLYHNLYDVNLHVYKALPGKTIVEIQYYPKSKLDKGYLEQVKNNNPMLHCKVAIPPYVKNERRKFDINWELGGFRSRWKMFWWRLRGNSGIKKKDETRKMDK